MSDIAMLDRLTLVRGTSFLWLLLITGSSLFSLSGCKTLGGKSIEVEFSSAPGLTSGGNVYLQGVPIGSSGSPTLVAGKVRVPVTIFRANKEAIAPGAVFLISDDSAQPGKKCLVAYQFSGGVAPASQSPQVYQGASGWLEVIMIVGKEKADQIRRDLMR